MKSTKTISLEQLMEDNSAEIGVFKDKINQFKLVTFDWVSSNIGPIDTLSKETMTELAMYMVDASPEACKYAGVNASFHKGYSFSLLVAMGYHEGEASGMMHAMSTPTASFGTDLTFGLGSSGFNAWVRDGDGAAQIHIRDAMAIWQSAIYGNSRHNHGSTNNDSEFSESTEFGHKVVEALANQTIFFARNGVMPDKAKDNWSIGYIIGFTDAMLQSNGSIEHEAWGAVRIAVFIGLFGEEQGLICIRKYHELFATGDAIILEGTQEAKSDISKWVNKRDTTKNCIPLAWGNHVLGLTEEVEKMRKQAFQEYNVQYISEVKRIDPSNVVDGLHLVELVDDEGTRRAFRDGIAPNKLAEIFVRDFKITDMKW